jgi:hypothetical protein
MNGLAPRPTSALPAGATSEERSRAKALLAATAAVIAYGLVLLIAFDPGVETLDAGELAASDDAVPFLVADLFFPLLYGAVLPLAMWRFSGERWARAAALLFAAAGLIDWVENTLLLSATDAPSEGAVDAGHVAGWVNIVLFSSAALPGLVLLARAIRTAFRGAGSE